MDNLQIEKQSEPLIPESIKGLYKNELLSFFYCPKCFQIPKISVSHEYITIECCGHIEGEKVQKNVDEINSIEQLLSFAEYKSYKLLLETYDKMVVDNMSISPSCQASNHGSDKKYCQLYCADCRIFICDDCLKSQQFHMNLNHKLLKTSGMRLCSKCEENECQSKIGHYCYDCKKHYCENCIKKDKHNKHSFINII